MRLNLIKTYFIYLAVPTTVLSAFWFISRVFDGEIILAQQFTFFGFGIHYYGVILGIAILLAIFLAQSRMQKYELSKVQAEQIFMYVIIGGFIGARLYHVLTEFGYYQNRLLEIPAVWNGGLSIYGAVMGGAVALYIYLRRHSSKQSLWQLLDWLAPSLALGQAIGRFGNLFNYEAFGSPTNLPWKMYVPEMFRPAEFSAITFFTPLFLYESLGLFLIVLVLLKLKTSKLKSGTLFLTLILMYNTMRIFTENLRLDSVFIGEIRLNMVVSALLCTLAIYGLVRLYGQEKTLNH